MMKKFVNLVFMLLILTITHVKANPLYEIDMEKCPVFLAKLHSNKDLAKASRIEEIFKPFQGVNQLKEDEIDRKITWKIVCYDVKISHELRASTKDTCEMLMSKVEKADSKLLTDEQKRMTIDQIRASFKKRKDALDIVISSVKDHNTEYPATLWNAYISRLLLGINEDTKEANDIMGGTIGQFDFIFEGEVKRQLWSAMKETGFIKSTIDVESFKYSPTEVLSQAWKTGKYTSIVVGCGRFDRKYVQNLRALDDYNMNLPTAMNCGGCDQNHVNELTLNFDPIQMPDVIADGLKLRVWEALEDNSIPEIRDESGHSIFLKAPEVFKILWLKLKKGGSIPGHYYLWDGIKGLEKPEDIVAFGKTYGFEVEYSVGQQVSYKFVKP